MGFKVGQKVWVIDKNYQNYKLCIVKKQLEDQQYQLQTPSKKKKIYSDDRIFEYQQAKDDDKDLIFMRKQNEPNLMNQLVRQKNKLQENSFLIGTIIVNMGLSEEDSVGRQIFNAFLFDQIQQKRKQFAPFYFDSLIQVGNNNFDLFDDYFQQISGIWQSEQQNQFDRTIKYAKVIINSLMMTNGRIDDIESAANLCIDVYYDDEKIPQSIQIKKYGLEYTRVVQNKQNLYFNIISESVFGEYLMENDEKVLQKNGSYLLEQSDSYPQKDEKEQKKKYKTGYKNFNKALKFFGIPKEIADQITDLILCIVMLQKIEIQQVETEKIQPTKVKFKGNDANIVSNFDWIIKQLQCEEKQLQKALNFVDKQRIVNAEVSRIQRDNFCKFLYAFIVDILVELINVSQQENNQNNYFSFYKIKGFDFLGDLNNENSLEFLLSNKFCNGMLEIFLQQQNTEQNNSYETILNIISENTQTMTKEQMNEEIFQEFEQYQDELCFFMDQKNSEIGYKY